MNPDTTLADLGLDSLMGVEVKQTLERDLDLVLAMREVRQLTVNKLRELTNGGGQTTSSEPEARPEASPESPKSEERSLPVKFDLDRMLPTEVIVRLAEGKGGEMPLFVTHPIEGTLNTLVKFQNFSIKQLHRSNTILY